MNKEQFCKIYPALPTIWSYLINCKRCTKKDPTLPYQYIGHVCRTLRERCGEHRYGVENNIDESFPTHFNQPKYTLNDVQVIPLLHVNSNRDSIRLPMEQHLIDKAGALKNGISRTCDRSIFSIPSGLHPYKYRCCTYISQTLLSFIFFVSFTNLGSYSHFYIFKLLTSLSIIYFVVASFRPCSVTLIVIGPLCI